MNSTEPIALQTTIDKTQENPKQRPPGVEIFMLEKIRKITHEISNIDDIIAESMSEIEQIEKDLEREKDKLEKNISRLKDLTKTLSEVFELEQ